MKFKEVEAEDRPIQTNVNLDAEVHKLEGYCVNEGFCGDHYCPGHTAIYFACSCGRVLPGEDEDKVRKQHIEEVLMHKTNVSFK